MKNKCLSGDEMRALYILLRTQKRYIAEQLKDPTLKGTKREYSEEIYAAYQKLVKNHEQWKYGGDSRVVTIQLGKTNGI